jgi:hypothetical protein
MVLITVDGSSSHVLLLVWRILFEGAVFLLPGIAFAWLIESRYRLDVVRFVSLVFIASGAAAYVGFWAYLVGPTIGKTVGSLILATSLVTVAYAALTRRIKRQLFHGLITCALLMAVLTAFYTALGFLYNRSENPGTQAALRFVHPLPPDNILPQLFADDLYCSKPFKPFLFIDWSSSDRPPLQSAIVLLQRPLWNARESGLDYQILATFLQSMWIAAAWLLLQGLSLDRRTAVCVYAFCILSGFFLLNTFYTWPKLLAAAFFTIALAVLRFPDGMTKHCDSVDAALGGAAIGLAWLSHGGIAFSVIALAIVLLVGGNLPPIRSAASGILAFLLLLLPWSAYQKFYDPPGDRLLKWHLAGVIDRDSRSFGQAFLDAYTKPPLSQIVTNKIANVRTLVGPGPWDELRQARETGASQSKRLLRWYKSGTFFFFFQTIGILNLGFIAFLYARVFSPHLKRSALVIAMQRLFVLAFVSLGVWCLLIYIPGSNVIHAGSYGTVVLLFIALGVSLASVSRRLTYVLMGFQALFLFPLFALTDAFMKSHSGMGFAGGADPAMACLAAFSLLILAMLVVFGRLSWVDPEPS